MTAAPSAATEFPVRRIFATLPDGSEVEEVTLRGGGLSAKVLTWGAVVRDLRLDGHAPPLVLGFERMEDYLAHSRNHGGTVGRVANRIGGGRFTLDGWDHELERNERGGLNHTHGGSQGVGRRNWRVEQVAADRVTLALRDPDGNAGYPGNVDIRAQIALEDGALKIAYEAECDAPTPVNLAHHGYFNLDGGPTILDHRITILAEDRLPLSETRVPTGELAPLTGTPWDLREPTVIGPRMEEGGIAFDMTYVLARAQMPKRVVARVEGPESGLVMEVATTEPGIVFFAAVPIDIPVPGLEGRRYGPSAGLCLEAQNWPDAVNHADFPNSILRPGETLRQETDYIFRRA